MDPSYSSSLGNLNPGGATQSGELPQPPQPLSSGQGDIVLNNSQPKKSKKWWIIGTSAVLAVVAIVAAVIVINYFNSNSKEAALRKYQDLVEFLEKGKIDTDDVENDTLSADSQASDNDESSDNYNYIRAISIYDESSQSIQDYYKVLNEKLASFYQSAEGKVSKDLLKQYKKTMMILENSINYREEKNKLISVLVKNNQQNLEKYISDNISCESDDVNLALKSICNLEANYYDSVLFEYQTYQNLGCKINDSLDIVCSDKLWDNEEFVNQALFIDNPESYIVSIQSGSARKVLDRFIKEINAKLLEEIENA